MAASDSEKARAVVKGFFQSQPGKAEWPGDPEEACIKHSSFLKLWLPMGLSKPKSREAWKGAFSEDVAGGHECDDLWSGGSQKMAGSQAAKP